MALPVREQAKYWGIALAVFVLILWFLGDVLTPFVLAGAIAYLLDPIADWFEARGLNRGLSVAIISVIAVLLFALLLLLVIPTLIGQAEGLFAFFADLVDRAPLLADQAGTWIDARFGITIDEQAVREQLIAVGEFVRDRSGQLATGVLSSAASLVNVVVLFVLVPVITVYLLVDWDRMVARIDDLLPREHAPTIRRIFAEIDQTLASFIRGQGTVCLILGTFYAIALGIMQLNFGIVIGAFAGFVSFIPYVGAILGGLLAIGVALVQFWGDWWWIVGVALVFQVGQVVEGNILTPNLVGSSVGLHPVWLILALAVFGALFGFIGLLIAVPVAAVIGVVARFGVTQYRHSELYRGPDGAP
ncbi:AI-2E family transporter [Histidinibacterium aquaticum]|uniref:AI-2E family transporter n=1 Tax=Histidinibacterium aquaticum TaxID=2613962 RepID=A0A5J5GQS3_9RHOB|nr:AI-2E family transporter [Histidinibacterium aquaticum]KAA9009908.1 AI-2E family transporter [Histidinibacterium aquaticum]